MARNATDVMWAEAVTRLARADRLHRDFFRPGRQGWEPPVDLLETADELIIIAALPGVQAGDVEVVAGNGEIAITGTRRQPGFLHRAQIHRMELPHGRFERRVAIPPGRFEVTRRNLADGLLVVGLRRLG